MHRKKAEFHTGKYCKKEDWEERYMMTLKDSQTNNYLSYIKTEIETAHYHLTKDGKDITANVLRSVVRGDNDKLQLLDVFEKDIKKLSNLTQEYTPGTLGMYRTTLKHLTGYLRKAGLSRVYVQGFTYQHVEAFEYYLKVDKEMGINTATKYLKKLNAFYTRAVKQELLNKSPFEEYKFKHKKTHKTFLTIPQVETIQALEGMPPHIKIARDIFVFAVYTGLRYSDIFNLRNSNIEGDGVGNDWIRIIMKKTNDYLRIPLLEVPKAIIELYKEQSEASGRPLPKMVEQRYNLYLKDISERAKLDKKLTSHVARHTFATSVRIKYGIPIEVTSKLLGHRKIATTMVYSQITDDEVLRYMKD